jgi:hypothetical protein
MNETRRFAWRGALLALVCVAGCQNQAPPAPGPVKVQIDGSEYRLEGPFTHENLAVFLLCSDRQNEQDFLTLEEGLKEGLVSITEQEKEQVGALQIENKSDRPLYLQEGERLQGGKQDRTIIASLAIPPKSGKTSVPTFCVERSRWTEGEKGREFGFTVNPALAPKGVRGAAKVDGSQDGVWACVKVQKFNACAALKTANTNSSVNELLDDAKVRALSDEYAEALGKAVDAPWGRDVVGVVIVQQNQIEEIDVYPNRALFGKLYPRLVQAYALQAALLKEQDSTAEPMTTAAVAQFLSAGAEKTKQDKELDAYNRLQIRELEDNKFQCTTSYNGEVIHRQVLKKNGSSSDKDKDKEPMPTPRAAILGSKW